MTAPAPSAPEPALQTAARLLAEARPGDAAAYLGDLVREAPAYAAAHVLHATALEAAGRPADALAAWDQAAFLVPRSPLVRRERQRLATALAAPAPEVAPPSEPVPEASAETAPAETAPAEAAPDLAPDSLVADVVHDAPDGLSETDAVPDAEDEGVATLPLADLLDVPPATPADDTPDGTDSLTGADPEPPAIQGLPLESLTTLFETDTPFFGDDDEDETVDDDPLRRPLSSFFTGTPDPEAVPDDVPPAAPAEASAPDVDWGDLPPLAASILPPEGAAPPAGTPPPAPEPDGWRVVETLDGVPLDAPDLTFEPPAAPADDLDALISQLEQAPRIRPDPAFSGPAVRPDDSGVDEMVSETLAQIYAAQHRYVEAAVMYEKLAQREPAQAPEWLRRAAELRGRP